MTLYLSPRINENRWVDCQDSLHLPPPGQVVTVRLVSGKILHNIVWANTNYSPKIYNSAASTISLEKHQEGLVWESVTGVAIKGVIGWYNIAETDYHNCVNCRIGIQSKDFCSKDDGRKVYYCNCCRVCRENCTTKGGEVK